MERREAIEQAVAHLPLMLTVEQARDVLGIGRSLAYGEVRRYLATGGREGIPAVRIGSAIRIPRAGLVDLLLSARDMSRPVPKNTSVDPASTRAETSTAISSPPATKTALMASMPEPLTSERRQYKLV